ncbi:MAG TPA: proline--tRNA ligase [Candidatus Kapabacteria bacterium]|nr:proline--tRNA ligase [Candidatus Kapabacteria bacterium]
MSDEAVTPRSQDYSAWYLEVIKRAQLVDYGPVKGTMVIRPYGYALWEHIRDGLDRRFKETGHENAYFPMFIPYSFFQKEKDHLEGFSPELALVTHAGGKELEEPLVVRPTSETIINHMYSQWVKSYRDLPILINQWANVVRWELRTRPFLRTTEFLWQEGHTVHATAAEAEEETLRMLGVYTDFAFADAAIPVIPGRKSNIEKFAGAVHSYTIEAMMGDGKALQSGTSHNLGQNFAKMFDTQFQSEEGKLEYVWQTSWGVSTRMVGAVLMAHGDDKGLIIPPKLAPYQAVIVPIWNKDEDKPAVREKVAEVERNLKAAGIRVKADLSEQETAGWKFNEYEMRGVPLRIEIGPKDVAKDAVVFARRDRPGKEGKQFGIPTADVGTVAREWLDDIQAALLRRATEFRDANIVDVTSYDQLKEVIANAQWARVWWNGSDDQERAIKEETGATIRCFPIDQPGGSGRCFYTDTEATEVALFARAY